MALGWVALVVSIIGGLGHMATWDRYYISYRDHAANYRKGKLVRKTINRWRRLCMICQFGGLAVGLFAMVAFYANNLEAPSAPTGSATTLTTAVSASAAQPSSSAR